MSTQFFSFSDDTPFSTEAVLANASSSHYEEDWPSIPHTHAFTELFYVSEGSGEFLIENQHFSIKKDDLIIVNPHIQHTEISLSASPLSYYTVGVDGISFSFHDQKEFQIFHCHQKHADLLFYFHSLNFRSWWPEVTILYPVLLYHIVFLLSYHYTISHKYHMQFYNYPDMTDRYLSNIRIPLNILVILFYKIIHALHLLQMERYCISNTL